LLSDHRAVCSPPRIRFLANLASWRFNPPFLRVLRVSGSPSLRLRAGAQQSLRSSLVPFASSSCPLCLWQSVAGPLWLIVPRPLVPLTPHASHLTPYRPTEQSFVVQRLHLNVQNQKRKEVLPLAHRNQGCRPPCTNTTCLTVTLHNRYSEQYTEEDRTVSAVYPS
jgi:hypothetical protein